ncbi:MAG: carboxypeptidase-like regulatory domain-containing protein [Chitinophagaceae bacterium]
MNPQEDHINYTAADIEKYWKGELSAQQRHAMEKAALDDPFLADAMEGYEEKTLPGRSNISSDVDILKQRLAERVNEKDTVKTIGFGWWKIAAVFLVIAGAALVYTLMNGKKESSNDDGLAKNKADNSPAATVTNNDSAIAKADSTILTDSSTLVAINKPKASKPAIGNAVAEEKSTLTEDKDAESVIAAPPASAPVASVAESPVEKRKESLATGDSVQYKKEEVAKLDEAKKRAGNISLDQKTLRAKSFQVNDDKSYSYNRSSFDNNKFANTYNGTVVDKANHPVANALVQIPNLNVATQTNQLGYFSFNAPDTTMKVSIASDGFETQQAIWRNKASLNQIVLKPTPPADRDVVVQSNGAARKEKNVQDISVKIMDAEPVDGWPAFNAYIEKSKRIPEDVKNIHGTVIVSFEVHNKWINNFNIDQSLDEDLDAEAIRLLRDGPKWKLLKGKKAIATVAIKF